MKQIVPGASDMIIFVVERAQGLHFFNKVLFGCKVSPSFTKKLMTSRTSLQACPNADDDVAFLEWVDIANTLVVERFFLLASNQYHVCSPFLLTCPCCSQAFRRSFPVYRWFRR